MVSAILIVMALWGCGGLNPDKMDPLLKDALRFNAMGVRLQKSGDYESALSSYERALTSAQMVDALDVQAMIEHNVGSLFQYWGKWTEALEAYTRSRILYVELDDRKGIVREEIHMAGILVELKKPTEALSILKEVLRDEVTMRDDSLASMAYGQLAKAKIKLGELNEALGYLNKAIDLARATGQEVLEASHLSQLGVLLIELGRYDDAREALLKALEIDKKNNNLRGVAYDLAYLAHLDLKLKNPAGVRKWAYRAIPLLKRFSMEQLLKEVRLWLEEQPGI